MTESLFLDLSRTQTEALRAAMEVLNAVPVGGDGPGGGSTNRTIETTVMTENCKANIVGTQDIDVVGVQGSFAGDTNFSLKFSPKSAPNYTAPNACPDTGPTKASNGIDWLDFSNGAYQDGMIVKLPDKPGGTWTEGQGQGQQKDDPCTILAPLLGCTWTRTLTVQYGTGSGT